MLSRLFFLVSLIFLIISCRSPKKRDVPDGILSEKEMVNVLINIHLAEAKTNDVKGKSKPNQVAIYRIYQDEVYDKFGIDSLIFKQSHDFYMGNIIEMRDIYKQVVDSLGKMQKVMEEEKDKKR
ncbi:MAG: DUF4296 domain-containing protein [Flammeovirgaceae bacterium]|nr:DUF4296 domain-containing protein [Flammeovirgaceae bacterium]